MVLEVEKQLHHCAPPAARFPSHQNDCRFLLLIWQCPGGNKMLHNTDKKSQITACSSLEAWHGDGDNNRIGEHSGKEKSSTNSEIMLLFPDTCCAAWRGIKSRISKLWNIVFHFLGSRFSFIKSWFLKKSIKKKKIRVVVTSSEKYFYFNGTMITWTHIFSGTIIGIEKSLSQWLVWKYWHQKCLISQIFCHFEL